MGVAAALVGVGLLSAAMLPLRAQLSVATTALVLVVPVVVGVAVGGYVAGAVGVVAGFAAYDWWFIPPYSTFSVGEAQNWVALGVYVVVTVVVSQVVVALRRARTMAHRREQDALRLFEISDMLIGDRPTEALLDSVVSTVRRVFALQSVVILLPSDGRLAVAASDGEAVPQALLRRIMPEPGRPAPVPVGGSEGLFTITLSTSARPVGILAFVGADLDANDRQLLATFANHAALAVERAQLQGQATRTRMLEELDRWRGALLGSVSHDLRTPLASIKAAVSDLRDPGVALARAERAELLEMIESEADRLSRLVTNLLDMTRIEAGALEAHCQVVVVDELVHEALGHARWLLGPGSVESELAPDLPAVSADPVLVGQVLANLVENAARHTGVTSRGSAAPAAPAPTGTEAQVPPGPGGGDPTVAAAQGPPGPGGAAPIRIAARAAHGVVELSVADRGPGIPPERRADVFEAFHRLEARRRDGLGGGPPGTGAGLAIAKAFVEVQGGRIRVEDNPGGGTVVVFSLPAVALRAEVR